MESSITHKIASAWNDFLPALLPALAAALYGWAVFASTFHHPGSIGLDYLAPGSDWMILYGTVRLAIHSQLQLTLDSHAFASYINSSFVQFLPHQMDYRPWVYPPSFLVILWPFGLLGFTGSYAAFEILSAALLVTALLVRSDRPLSAKWVCLAALACPAASINVVDGQCGFLVAGLLVLGFRLLPVRPIFAGALLGLVTFKPQFGLMVPVALLALREWRGVAGATLSSLGLITLSVVMLGWQPWLWWIGHAAFSYGQAGSEWASFERVWGNSVYACASLLGASPGVALVAQLMAVATAAGSVFIAYSRPREADIRLAILLVAAVLAAPHSSCYDELLLVLGGMLWFGQLHAARLMDAVLLLLLWLAPLLGPPLLIPAGRAEPLLALGFIVVALRTGRVAGFHQR